MLKNANKVLIACISDMAYDRAFKLAGVIGAIIKVHLT